MSKNLSTRKLIILLGVIDLVLIAGYTFALWSLDNRNQKIIELNKEVDSYSATDGALSSLQRMLIQAESGMGKIDTFYVPADGVVSFIGSIENLGRQSGLTVEIEGVEASDVDKTTKAFQEKILVRVETRGTWADTLVFLKRVENLPYKISISAASMARLDGTVALSKIWKGDFAITVIKLK